MKKIPVFLSALCLTAALIVPASAAGPMEYNISAPGNPEYGKPTSIEVVHTADGGAMKNTDVSKNAALAPPTFGSCSADALNTGTPLTPNLAPGYQPTAGAVVNGGAGIVAPPSVNDSGTVYVPGASTVTVSTGYTEVTDDLYYSGGYLGTLKIPSIGINVKVYEGTDTKALAKGAGHFPETSIWDGNCAIAGHNHGAHGIFGSIHTLELGDRITLTTKLGTRIYSVVSVNKISETDNSLLTPTAENCITLFTCVRNQSAYRWCVQAVEIV